MPKGYWISAHQRPADPEKHKSYREIAIPAIEASGGKFLVIGGQIEVREFGKPERTVVIEFPSYADAISAYESKEYKRALVILGDGAERDLRIVEGA